MKTKKSPKTETSKVEVYSDGSGTNDTLPGGWAFVIVKDGQKIHEDSGSMQNATNNVAEITAATKGLEYVSSQDSLKDSEVTLVSDSQIALKFSTGEWIPKAWHLLSYAIKLRKARESLGAETRWVKGHNGDEHNERCDKLAKSARQELMSGTEVKSKT